MVLETAVMVLETAVMVLETAVMVLEMAVMVLETAVMADIAGRRLWLCRNMRRLRKRRRNVYTGS